MKQPVQNFDHCSRKASSSFKAYKITRGNTDGVPLPLRGRLGGGSLSYNITRPIALLCLTSFLLSACGFSPIYGDHGGSNSPVTAQMNQVLISNIPNHEGQMLRNNLIDRMYSKGRPTNPRYRLDISIRTTEEDLGILADNTSTRALLNMYADYTLNDEKGKHIVHGTARSVASFNKLSQQYGTQSAREGAKERTLIEVSNQIVNRLGLYFAEHPVK